MAHVTYHPSVLLGTSNVFLSGIRVVPNKYMDLLPHFVCESGLVMEMNPISISPAMKIVFDSIQSIFYGSPATIPSYNAFRRFQLRDSKLY
jgi:hypothetical protein